MSIKMLLYNKLIYTILFVYIFSIQQAFNQCDTNRYQKQIFNSVIIYQDVVFGSAEAWNIPYNDVDLKMDIYLPSGDSLTKRPLMIWAHPGGFLNGSKSADDMVAFCDSFAKRGYVTASIDYRLGFNPTSETSAERAGYRAVQDMRAAIRFLKENYQLYGIDTNYTFIGGSSAGALMVDQLVYLDQNEAPSSIGAGVGYPALGCLDCTGNQFQHAMDITAYVSLWGALEDSTWIDTDETTPGLLVHGKADGTVPFAIGHPFGVPTMPLTQGSRCISNQLSALGIPHQTYFVEGVGHEFYGADNGTFNNPPNAYWDTIFNKIQALFYRQLPKDTFSIQGPNIVCQNDTVVFQIPIPNNFHLCWSVNNGNIISTTGNTVRFVCNQPGNVTISALQYSEIMAYNGKTSFSFKVFQAPTVNFTSDISEHLVHFAPLPSGFVNYLWDFGDGTGASNLSPTHLYPNDGSYLVSLNVKDSNGCAAAVRKTITLNTTDIIEQQKTIFSIYPNPSTSTLNVTGNKLIKRIALLSIDGKTIQKKEIQGKTTQLKINNLESGIYILKIISSEDQIYLRKIQVK